MYTYDRETNTLVIKQCQDFPLPFDVLGDQRRSYEEYLKKGIFEDAQYFLDKVKEKTNNQFLTAEFELGELHDSNYRKEVKKRSNKYYPLYATFYNSGVATPKVTLMRIPYMDDECKLNVDGQSKVILLEQTASNDISFNMKTNVLTIQTRGKSLNFQVLKSGVNIKTPQKKYVGLDAVVRGLRYSKGLDPDLTKIFRNSFLTETSNFSRYYMDADQFVKLQETGVYDTLTHEVSALGYARDSLNEALQIDSCLSQILSRPLLGYSAGTVITQEMLKEFKKNKINCVYVKDIPKVNGWILDEYISITRVPKGTPNCKFLQKDPRFINERDNAYLSDDFIATGSNVILFTPGDKLTVEDLEFLSLLEDIDCIRCKRSAGATPKEFYFEREILGNHSFRAVDVYDNLPQGVQAEDWVYTYPTEEDSEHLNLYDLQAIFSLMARIYTTGTSPILNKDTSYLKKVNLCGDTFSIYFRRSVTNFLRAVSRKVSMFMSLRTTDENIFYGLYSDWRKSLLEGKVLVSADTINAMAEMSQVCHVSTLLNNSASVDDAMRNLAIPYFGRICPYETPAGKKLGLVNTKALGAKIINGLLCVPYRRVIHDGGKYKLSDDVRYMSVKEEQKYRIGDLQLLDWCEDGIHFNNKQTIAIAPNPAGNGTSMMFTLLESGNLDYVTCHSEQHVSPTVCIVPYAQHDDANRINFGISQIRQCIYLWHSDQPHVRTFMNAQLFEHPNSFLTRAKKSGEVIDITHGCITVLYDGDSDYTDINIEESRITNDSMLFMNYRKGIGDRFKAGDILVDTVPSRDGIYSPGRDELVAYIATGYNHEDGIDIANDATYDYISIGSASVERKLHAKQSRSMSVGNVNQFRYIEKGDSVMELTVQDRRDATLKHTITVSSENHEGLLYNIETLKDKKSTVFRGNMVSLNKLGNGDKMAGLHGNKGVVTHTMKTSEAPQLANGMTIKICLNPHGVPSRMNMGQILECHTGLIAHVTDTNIQVDPFNGANTDDLRILMKLAYELANTPNMDDPNVFNNAMLKYSMLPREFLMHCYATLSTAQQWAGTFNEEGDAMLWDPTTDSWFEYPVTIGFSTMLKLMQEADEKEHSRAGALEEPYNVITKQPPQGSRRKGGQRDGEMELVGIASHGAVEFLHEVCNEKSDNEGARSNIHLEALGYPMRNPEEYCVPRSYETLSYDLEALNVKLDTSMEDELPDLNYEYSHNKALWDVTTIAHSDPNEEPAVDDATDAVLKALDSAWGGGE